MDNFWQILLDDSNHDYRAHEKIHDMELQVALSADIDMVGKLAARLSQAERQIDKLVLGCAAMARLLEMKGVIPDEALVTMMQQLDLLDGVEDGAMKGRIQDDAPRCQGCNRFVNPARAKCVYCSRSLTANPDGGLYRGAPVGAPAVAQVTCSSCKNTVAQTDTVFNEQAALVCVSCA